jgi:hypothetical protein
MKVFLSWSGNESKQLAEIFKEWLPNVLQYIEPYMSAKDISLGERWNNNLTDRLEESSFGLVFVTPSNINAPWINYEAGALSKTIDSKVVPILYNADVMILNEGPLKQFQSAKDLKEESILSLVKSINGANEEGKLNDSRLEKAFEMWWPTLDDAIENIAKEESADSSEQEPSEKQMLKVIFSKLNEQEKFLNKNKNNLLEENLIPPALIEDLILSREALHECRDHLKGGPFPDDLFIVIEDGIKNLDKGLRFLKNRRKKIEFITNERHERANKI